VFAITMKGVKMAVLGGAVVVLAVVVVFNLLITFAVLRRLRVHEERLARGVAVGEPGDDLLGRALPTFTATSTTGATVTDASGTARLVGFFSATCAPCREQARAFAQHDDPNRLAIVLMEDAPAADQEAILAALAGSPSIVADSTSSELATMMGVSSFPQLLQLDSTGIVVDARHSVRALAATGK
jgi:hypothetical protein